MDLTEPQGFFLASDRRPAEVRLVVLEAARIKAPVNNVNMIASTDVNMIVNGEACVLPAGTVMAASIGLASVDSTTFAQAEVFDHRRPGPTDTILDFAGAGDRAPRGCPGRLVAERMGVDLFVASRS